MLGETGAYAGLTHPILSRDEDHKLLLEMSAARELAANGDRGARARFERLRNRVCAGYLRFALALSKRYLRRRGRLELEDLLQIAGLGLMRACESFEPERGIAFSTYAGNLVRHYLGRGIADHGRIVRVPVNVQDARAQCNRTAWNFVGATGRAPNVDELSKLTGLRPGVTARAWTQPYEAISLDEPTGNGHSDTLADALTSDCPTPLDALLAKERAESARTSMASLDAREREVVELRTGDAEMSLEAIGATLTAERTGRVGLCRERVRQIEQQAVARLRLRADDDLRLDS
jgi:RNA polymerase sigma factor (sigma-70 family)